MKTQREEEEEEDRLSQLPPRLLYHILSKLDLQQAVQTCVLSKSWRYLVATRPTTTFCEKWFTEENKNQETFVSFVDTTIQRYQDQKLSLEDFWLEMSEVDSESKRLLEKWVRILTLNVGVKTFNLFINSKTSTYFDLPSELFIALLPLQNLYLRRCMLSQINSVSIVDNVVFKHLETLNLREVYIADETFEKIMSCCPSIQNVSLEECVGLNTIKVTADNKLIKLFEYTESNKKEEKDDCKIKIDVLTIEEIGMWGCPNWFHHHCHKNFLHLKYLCLGRMRLSTKSFGTFANNFPCLEDLRLYSCYGFKEIKLSSSSIERLSITGVKESTTKVTIHAPNILYFYYESKFLPSSFSFTTATGRHGWKSDLCLEIGSIDYSSWFFRLNEVLGALSQSDISLHICNGSFHEKDTHQGGLTAPVAVGGLVLSGFYPRATFQSFLNMLFRVCRPRNIFAKQALNNGEDEELTKLLCKFLPKKSKEKAYNFMQPDLKEVRIELCDDDVEDEMPYTLFGLIWKEKS